METIYKSASEAIQHISSNSTVFIHAGAATPRTLLKELTAQGSHLENVTILHLHTEGPAEYADPRFRENYRVVNLFIGSNMRPYIDGDRVDYIPVFLSEIANLFKSGVRPIDVALLHVSPPDRSGHCSLGVSVDVAKAAAQSAKFIIAQVNPNMPRVHGDGFIKFNDIDIAVEVHDPLPEHPHHDSTPEELAIAKHVASLVEDGSTLQMGIGAIPNAVAAQLSGHRDLGIHSEMWSDGVLDLIQSGAVTNSKKKFHAGKCVSTFLVGSQRLFDFIHDNPSVIQLEADYVNNSSIIARNPKVVAVNSAVQIDLSGQVNADSVGHRPISGIGGQMDFMRGAALSDGGKPILAITSCTKNGDSKIVFELNPGAGVVTTRGHVHYVVTEYGVANLHGLTLGERARALIGIAHPRHRAKLAEAARI